MRLTAAASLLCAVLGAPFALAQDKPGRAEKTASSAAVDPKAVDAYVEQMMARRHIPGVSVAVVKDGKVVLAKGYGMANLELRVPATDETVYQLASVTKTFTATAVMLLVRDGKLSLDDKVTEKLSGLPSSWGGVTVRHLLNHTSGIKSYTSVKGFGETSRKDYSRREIIELVAKEPLEFEPGERWAYCNTGYFLLGMLIEEASGKPYADFMAERVFRPTGMDRTRVNDLHAIIPNRAQGYQWDGKELRNGEYVSPTQPFAAGALVSTVGDLVKWDAALSDHKLIDEATQDRMWQPTKLSKGEAGYGYGWSVGKANGHRMISHGGGIPGFSTELARFVDDKLTVIVLSNADGGHAGQLARGIAGHFVPELAEKPLAPIDDPDPKTTERLRGVIEGAQKGEFDPGLFTEEANKQLVPIIKADKDRVAAFGGLREFRLLERNEQGGGLTLQYRATFEKETLRFVFRLDKDGKIQGIGIRPEN